MSRTYETWRSSTLSYERLAAAVPLTADSVDLYAGTVKGIASVFGSPVKSRMGLTKVMPGAFAKTLAAHPDVNYFKFFREHHTPVGVLTEALEAFDGLRITAKLSNTSLGRDTLIDIKNGTLGALSIGFDPTRVRLGTDATGEPVRLLEEVELWEVSACPWGADGLAHVMEAYARGGCPAARLADAALDRATALTAGWPQPRPRPPREAWEYAEMLHRAEHQYAHAILQQGAQTPSPEREYAYYLQQVKAQGRQVFADGSFVPVSPSEAAYIGPLFAVVQRRRHAAAHRREQQLYEAGCQVNMASTRRSGRWHVEAWNH